MDVRGCPADSRPHWARCPGAQLVGEMGMALDIEVLPALEVGVQGSYNSVQFMDSFDWWHTGLHVTLVL